MGSISEWGAKSTHNRAAGHRHHCNTSIECKLATIKKHNTPGHKQNTRMENLRKIIVSCKAVREKTWFGPETYTKPMELAENLKEQQKQL